MAATHLSNPVVLHVSTTLLGRSGLQTMSMGPPVSPPGVPGPVAVLRPQTVQKPRLPKDPAFSGFRSY